MFLYLACASVCTVHEQLLSMKSFCQWKPFTRWELCTAFYSFFNLQQEVLSRDQCAEWRGWIIVVLILVDYCGLQEEVSIFVLANPLHNFFSLRELNNPWKELMKIWSLWETYYLWNFMKNIIEISLLLCVLFGNN